MLRKFIVPVIFVVALLILLFLTSKEKSVMKRKISDINEINYVALGDSYTIGEGVAMSENYPSFLTAHLQKEGVHITLIASPSVTGYTAQDLIDQELPVYDSSNPTFATLLIGANDLAQNISKDTFQKNVAVILDRMQTKLIKKNKIIILTIPDFSVTKAGKLFGIGRNLAGEIVEFNHVLKEEARSRNLNVVDITPFSQKMSDDLTLILQDGLHPSAKMYKLWEEQLFPVILKLLT